MVRSWRYRWRYPVFATLAAQWNVSNGHLSPELVIVTTTAPASEPTGAYDRARSFARIQ
jgi:hypothetical protein